MSERLPVQVARPGIDPTIDRLAQWAHADPLRPALWFDDRDGPVSFGQLHRQASRVAHWLLSRGLRAGDGIALLMENRPELFALAWGARRAGLYFTPVSVHLRPAEVAHVLADCGAALLVTTPALAALAGEVAASAGWRGERWSLGGAAGGAASLDDALAAVDPDAPLPERPVGRDFLYSSGTSGRPKGIRRPLAPHAERFKDAYDLATWRALYGIGRDAVYLSPAPLYHAAPLRFTLRTLEVGGSCVVMTRFDAARALALIEQRRVTHSQWVPTMLIRLLALPPEVRARHDLGTHRVAIHAAAPCPPEVKRRLIEWWGPIVVEYYGGSEGIGLTAITSAQWRDHPGSVGPAVLGRLHVKDEQGRELPPNTQGTVWFSGLPRFEYHGDAAKTAAAYDAAGCATYGDIGHVDADGYLYLSGRRTDLILSGGVNLYPAEIEAVLATCAGVADVAVIGVPHAEFGEEVWAVVQPDDPGGDTAALARRLDAACRGQLSALKCPRHYEFVDALPRHDNGKLYKRLLMERYGGGAG